MDDKDREGVWIPEHFFKNNRRRDNHAQSMALRLLQSHFSRRKGIRNFLSLLHFQIYYAGQVVLEPDVFFVGGGVAFLGVTQIALFSKVLLKAARPPNKHYTQR